MQENEGEPQKPLLLTQGKPTKAQPPAHSCLDGLAELLGSAQQLHSEHPRLLAVAASVLLAFAQVGVQASTLLSAQHRGAWQTLLLSARRACC